MGHQPVGELQHAEHRRQHHDGRRVLGPGKISGGFGETMDGSGFGAQFGTTFKLDQIAPGDAVALKGAWAENEVCDVRRLTTARSSTGRRLTFHRGCVAFQHFWAPNLSSAVYLAVLPARLARAGVERQLDSSATWCGLRSPTSSSGIEGGYAKVNTATSGTWGVEGPVGARLVVV